jgi:hypothetical protein
MTALLKPSASSSIIMEFVRQRYRFHCDVNLLYQGYLSLRSSNQDQDQLR